MKEHDRRADWQLPAGVTRGVWDYTQSQAIAADYEAYFAGTPLFELDQRLIREHLAPREHDLMVDWGTGTGRAIRPWAAEGVRCVAVDLSLPMLIETQRKASAEKLVMGCVQANLAQLDCFREHQFDQAICLFSTLGMIRGRANRRAFLTHVRRTLKPGGRLALHIHNAWRNLWDYGRVDWLMQSAKLLASGSGHELGDKYFNYRGVPNFYLHTFWPAEIKKLLAEAQLPIVHWQALDVTASRLIAARTPLRDLRAGGWFIVCE